MVSRNPDRSSRVIPALVMSAMLSLSLSLSAASPASASRLATGPVIAQGVLTDPAGEPARGTVILYQDLLDEQNALVPLQWRSTASDGSYSLSLANTPSVAAVAARNGGYAHFAVVGATGSHSTIRFFSRRLTGTRWSGRWDSKDIRLTADTRLAPEAGRDLAKLRTDMGTTSTTEPDSAYWCEFELKGDWREYLPVGELHTRYADLTGSFTYGRTADTTSTVGVKFEGEGWKVGGREQISNSKEVEQELTRDGRFGRILEQNFQLKHWKRLIPPNGCGGFAPEQVVKPVAWVSGWNLGWDDSRFDGQCIVGGSKTVRLLDHDRWKRSDRANKLTAFSFSVGVSGANVYFETQSGSSEYVVHEYKTGDDRTSYYICGNNDSPVRSLRIFAGHKPPPPPGDCRPRCT